MAKRINDEAETFATGTIFFHKDAMTREGVEINVGYEGTSFTYPVKPIAHKTKDALDDLRASLEEEGMDEREVEAIVEDIFDTLHDKAFMRLMKRLRRA